MENSAFTNLKVLEMVHPVQQPDFSLKSSWSPSLLGEKTP